MLFPQPFVPKVGGRFAKPHIWGMLCGGRGYEICDAEVARFHRSQARIRITSAPARTSKSYAAAYDALPELIPAMRWDGKRYRPVAPAPGRNTFLVWIVGPDFKTNKEFAYLWDELVGRQKFHGIPYRLGRHSNSPKQGNMEIELLWGPDEHGEEVRTVIEGKSATNPESLQGEEVDLWIQSEAADQIPKIWQRYGSTRAKRAVFPTTPKLTGAWLKDLIDMAESVSHRPTCDIVCADDCPVIELGIESFAFTPRCNPTYDWVRYWQEHALAESRTAGRVMTLPADKVLACSSKNGHDCFDPTAACAAMRDPWFAEQFGGKWTFEADRVIPFKWQPFHANDWCHVLDEVPDWLYEAKHVVAVDYGFTDPACVLWMALGYDGQMLLYREIYESGIDVGRLVERILETNRKFGERIDYYVGDPQKPEVAHVFQRFGLPVIERNKAAMRDRASGHLRLVNALTPGDDGKPSLHVLSSKAGGGYGCDKTIAEWRVLRRKSGVSSGEWSPAAIAGADHAFDCARYLLSSMPRTPDRETHLDNELRWMREQTRRMRFSESHNAPLSRTVSMGA